ncbi:MAG TPA: hypothetical protein VGN80_19285 [Devosiaceae bacterium]|jgi:CDP-diglyceride synthetase|nr:hypothetical protein [Devosiaceae bacterium]
MMETIVGSLAAGFAAALFGLAVTRPRLYRRIALALSLLGVFLASMATAFAAGLVVRVEPATPSAGDVMRFAGMMIVGIGLLSLLVVVSFVGQDLSEKRRDR